MLAAPAAAQSSFVFAIDTGATSFTWDGTTSLGNIVEMPPQFTLSGTSELGLTTGGNPVGTGQYLGGGDALVLPDLHGEIPNPIPILPPLAEIDVTGLHIVVDTAVFPVDGAGNYATTGTATALAGTLIFDPIVGDTVITDLTGLTSDPGPAAGAITAAGAGMHLTLVLDLVIPFSDPGTGVTGSITLAGTMHANYACPSPANYCQTSPNSVGPGAQIASSGSTSIAQNSLMIGADLLPPDQFGIFYFGPDQTSVPFGDGIRCIGGALVRFPPVTTGPAGSAVQHFDFPNLPDGAMFEAGEGTNVQFWYRDPAAGGAGFNFSDALELFFCP
jgi:hypothetical protein